MGPVAVSGRENVSISPSFFWNTHHQCFSPIHTAPGQHRRQADETR